MKYTCDVQHDDDLNEYAAIYRLSELVSARHSAERLLMIKIPDDEEVCIRYMLDSADLGRKELVGQELTVGFMHEGPAGGCVDVERRVSLGWAPQSEWVPVSCEDDACPICREQSRAATAYRSARAIATA